MNSGRSELIKGLEFEAIRFERMATIATEPDRYIQLVEVIRAAIRALEDIDDG